MIEMQGGPTRFDDEPHEYASGQTKSDLHSTEGPEPNFSVHRYRNSLGRISGASSSAFSQRSLESKDHRTQLFQVPQQCSDYRVKEMFKTLSGRIGFTIRMDHQHKLLAEKIHSGSKLASLMCCCFSTEQSTMVALEISTQALRQKKFVTLRLLQGIFTEFEMLAGDMRLESKTLAKDERTVYNVQKKRSRNCPVSMELYAYEFVCGLLKGRLSQRVLDFRAELEAMCRSLESVQSNRRLEQLMQFLVKSARDIRLQLQPQSNPYHPEFVLFAIERYLSLTTYREVMKAYSEKSRKQNEQYEQRRKLILQQFDDGRAMSYLQIKKKYQLLQGDERPYHRAILTLENLNLEVSPRDKLRCIQEYYSDIKISCYEYHHGKEEISTMDDVLPVMIFTVLKARVANFYANVKIVEDYMRVVGRFQADQRVITNLFVGLEYIAKEWAVDA